MTAAEQLARTYGPHALDVLRAMPADGTPVRSGQLTAQLPEWKGRVVAALVTLRHAGLVDGPQQGQWRRVLPFPKPPGV